MAKPSRRRRRARSAGPGLWEEALLLFAELLGPYGLVAGLVLLVVTGRRDRRRWDEARARMRARRRERVRRRLEAREERRSAR